MATLIGLLAPVTSPTVARGATPALTVVAATRYDVQPEAGRVLVTADITATSHAVDTATTRSFFDRAFLAVPPEATSVKVSGGFGRANWTISEQKPGYILLSITFGGRLGAGQTTTLRLSFELRDRGEPPDRELRVSRTLVTFPVWALASTGTPGSTVSVSVPPEYAVSFPRNSIPGPVIASSGNRVWTSAPIPDPLKLDVTVRAERTPVYVDTPGTASTAGGVVTLIYRSWIDDPAWLSRMQDLMERGIPRLAAAIGRPWPLKDPLVIREVIDAPAEGIAGTFDPAGPRLDVVYSAGPEIALHEAAHVWFNGAMLADRWASEGFASYYAQQVASELEVPFDPAVVTPQLQANAVPLNTWASGDLPPPAGAERSAVEAYGYAASAELATKLAATVGPEGLQRVWSAITARSAPYQPPRGPVEVLAGPPDWRGLLDLLEDDGRTHVAGLWSVYVVRADQAGDLAGRTIARRAFEGALARAGDWDLPRAIRDAMRSWKFEAAIQQLALATAVLDERDALAAEASGIGLDVPPALAIRFAEATDLAPIADLVSRERAALEAIVAARAARPAAVGPFEWIGLLGGRADRSIAAAEAAYASLDPVTAVASATAAREEWQSAGDAGRVRLAVAGVVALVVLLATWLIFRLRRSSRTAV